jgi:hypothetical protein
MTPASNIIEHAPRGPIYKPKSGSVDYTDKYSAKLRAFREGTREQAIKELKQNKEWGKLNEYIRNLMGEMWPANRPKFRSRFVDNHLNRARRETLSTPMYGRRSR